MGIIYGKPQAALTWRVQASVIQAQEFQLGKKEEKVRGDIPVHVCDGDRWGSLGSEAVKNEKDVRMDDLGESLSEHHSHARK